jgi:hypothetical protein
VATPPPLFEDGAALQGIFSKCGEGTPERCADEGRMNHASVTRSQNLNTSRTIKLSKLSQLSEVSKSSTLETPPA